MQTLLVLLNVAIIISPANALLSAESAKTIQGQSPRFNATYESTIQNGKNFDLLGINYSGVDYFNQINFTSKLASSGLTYMNNKPNDITFTPTRKGATTAQATDSNGDIFGPDSVAERTTGSITADWYYTTTAGSESLLNATQKAQTFCELAIAGVVPYIKVGGPIILKTSYGDPISQNYPDSTIAITKNPQNKFNIELNDPVCYASPSLTYATGVYDPGTPLKFNPAAGFIPQATIANNFPTMGGDGLFFNLVVAGVNVQAPGITWSATSTPSASNVTATVAAEKSILSSASNLNYRANTMVMVTLRGPVASSFEIGATAPKFTGATTIKVTGTDTSVTPNRVVASYQFQIKNWYVTRSTVNGLLTTQTAWCSGLGSYRIPTASELTTATGLGWTGITTTNNYQRIVGASLFGEWGPVYAYSKTYGGIAEFYGTSYWTSSKVGSSLFYVNNLGTISAGSTSFNAPVACRSI
ncbi:hypothetical protein [Zophobihabitans entericus]|uniref:Uncharacterized protein n=1 Tax=Zophobihabitans entericus TaxID=1635327 RepID=A0A6G9I9A9_9GAMM|nr:hypothetical protein [Zophobihabitans entericus]QIQ20803.1 hypothetical protein IPMB12_03365 [Zophobihabitans entericus]